MKKQFTVISAFCGTGGSSLGYKWAGFKELLAIDCDKHAAECFKVNFPEVPFWLASVSDITGKEIMKFCNIKKNELDVFDGSPPCQGFSMAGKRKTNDSRNDLFKDYIRLVDDLKPKIFVMENVPGMAKGKMKGRFIEIIKELKSLSYRVKCKQMNAKYYNVPQSRERLIFMGIRNDLEIEPSYPMPINKVITVKQALYTVQNKTFCKDIKGYFQEKIWPFIKQGQNGLNGKYYSNTRLAWHKPAPTLCKSCSWAGFPFMIHPDENRGLTIEEAKRLCSFPDNWKLHGSYKDQWARLGNAVMPKFMQAIATTLRDEILIPYYKNNT